MSDVLSLVFRMRSLSVDDACRLADEWLEGACPPRYRKWAKKNMPVMHRARLNLEMHDKYGSLIRLDQIDSRGGF